LPAKVDMVAPVEVVAIMIRNAVADTDCPPYRPWVLLASLLALFSTISWSQTQLATVFGIVTDPSGAVVPEASVTVVNQSTGLKRQVLTGVTGQYRLAGLPTGNVFVYRPDRLLK
jgi:hypothetical protein